MWLKRYPCFVLRAMHRDPKMKFKIMFINWNVIFRDRLYYRLNIFLSGEIFWDSRYPTNTVICRVSTKYSVFCICISTQSCAPDPASAEPTLPETISTQSCAPEAASAEPTLPETVSTQSSAPEHASAGQPPTQSSARTSSSSSRKDHIKKLETMLHEVIFFYCERKSYFNLMNCFS